MKQGHGGKDSLRTAIAVLVWFGTNMGVVMTNKALLTSYSFRHPFLLTLLHMLSCSIFCAILMACRLFPMEVCKTRAQFIKICYLSAIFCTTVVLGNVSLRFIPVSFNQAISATAPAFTAVMTFFIQGKVESMATYGTLLPVVGGIVVASHFEPLFHVLGFAACLGGTALRALKSVVQALLLADGEKLSSLALLAHMAPIAAVILVPLTTFFEPDSGRAATAQLAASPAFAGFLALNCLLAFFVNLTNFLVTKYCGALTLQVLGNAKGVIAAVISVLIFQNPVTVLGWLGYAVTMGGVVAYSESRKRSSKREGRAGDAAGAAEAEQAAAGKDGGVAVSTASASAAAVERRGPNTSQSGER